GVAEDRGGNQEEEEADDRDVDGDGEPQGRGAAPQDGQEELREEEVRRRELPLPLPLLWHVPEEGTVGKVVRQREVTRQELVAVHPVGVEVGDAHEDRNRRRREEQRRTLERRAPHGGPALPGAGRGPEGGPPPRPAPP